MNVQGQGQGWGGCGRRCARATTATCMSCGTCSADPAAAPGTDDDPPPAMAPWRRGGPGRGGMPPPSLGAGWRSTAAGSDHLVSFDQSREDRSCSLFRFRSFRQSQLPTGDGCPAGLFFLVLPCHPFLMESAWFQQQERGSRCYQVGQSPAAIGASWSQDLEATHEGSRSVPFYDGGLASFLPKQVYMSHFEKSTNLRFN
jgi:hypothetical protein